MRHGVSTGVRNTLELALEPLEHLVAKYHQPWAEVIHELLTRDHGYAATDIESEHPRLVGRDYRHPDGEHLRVPVTQGEAETVALVIAPRPHEAGFDPG